MEKYPEEKNIDIVQRLTPRSRSKIEFWIYVEKSATSSYTLDNFS